MELSRQDYDVLIEAVESWEQKDFGKALMGGILDSMMSKAMPADIREKHKRDRDEERRKGELAAKVRKERSVMLRAKLIGLRDAIDAEKLFEQAATT